MSPRNMSPAKKVDPMPVAMPSAEVAPGRTMTPGKDLAAAVPANAAPTTRAAAKKALIRRRIAQVLHPYARPRPPGRGVYTHPRRAPPAAIAVRAHLVQFS